MSMVQYPSWWKAANSAAQTLVSAGSRLVSTLIFRAGQKRRDESRRGRHECLRHLTTFLMLAAPVFAVQVPAGTEIFLRLKTRVSSSTSKVKDTVDAMVIQ